MGEKYYIPVGIVKYLWLCSEEFCEHCECIFEPVRDTLQCPKCKGRMVFVASIKRQDSRLKDMRVIEG